MKHVNSLQLDIRLKHGVKSPIYSCSALSPSFVQHPRHNNSSEAETPVGNLLTRHVAPELPLARSNMMAADFGGGPRCAYTTGRLDKPLLNHPTPSCRVWGHQSVGASLMGQERGSG